MAFNWNSLRTAAAAAVAPTKMRIYRDPRVHHAQGQVSQNGVRQ